MKKTCVWVNRKYLESPLGLGINTVALVFLALLKETLRKLLQGVEDE
ncbi:hypothetical protein JEQ21_06950 [Streptococcus sp. 121]|nr:hypothetical protein [Streptococcus sp. 121]MBJ6746193.1 hypothetical protein [Streptococcus sp. 121]